MKPFILFPVLLLSGLGVGGGAALAVRTLLPVAAAAPSHREPAVTMTFTPMAKILAPLVSGDGRLSGYVLFDVAIETTDADAAFVTPRLPILLNAINMRTFRAPMASGADGMLPNLEVFRKIVIESSNEAFGPRIVQRVMITQAAPA